MREYRTAGYPEGYHYKYIDVQSHFVTKNLKDNVAKLFQQTIKLSLYI